MESNNEEIEENDGDGNISSDAFKEKEKKTENKMSKWKTNKKEYEADDNEEELMNVPSVNLIQMNVVEKSPKERFGRFDEELGSGSSKRVYRAYDYDQGREVAWNVFSVYNMNEEQISKISEEINLIKALKHPNIISFISGWFDENKKEVIMITEIFCGGSLKKYLNKIKHPRLRVIKNWCKQILSGLKYLHERPNPIIHRDIKADNIFINSNDGTLKIGDLGFSCVLKTDKATSFKGTPEFMAPEVYQGQYGVKVDIYSFGMCLLELITLERPFKECDNIMCIYENSKQGIMPKSLSKIKNEKVCQFIKLCLSDAKERPSASELLNSEFLNDLENEENKFPVLLEGFEYERSVLHSERIQTIKKENLGFINLDSTNKFHTPVVNSSRQKISVKNFDHQLHLNYFEDENISHHNHNHLHSFTTKHQNQKNSKETKSVHFFKDKLNNTDKQKLKHASQEIGDSLLLLNKQKLNKQISFNSGFNKQHFSISGSTDNLKDMDHAPHVFTPKHAEFSKKVNEDSIDFIKYHKIRQNNRKFKTFSDLIPDAKDFDSKLIKDQQPKSLINVEISLVDDNQIKSNKPNDEVLIKFLVSKEEWKKKKKIQFLFNLKEDTALGVVQELQLAIGLNEEEMKTLVEKLSHFITSLKTNMKDLSEVGLSTAADIDVFRQNKKSFEQFDDSYNKILKKIKKLIENSKELHEISVESHGEPSIDDATKYLDEFEHKYAILKNFVENNQKNYTNK